MSKQTKVLKKQRHGYSARTREIKMRKMREVRDLVNILRKKYAAEVVESFIAANYFIAHEGIHYSLKTADDLPVELATASITYRIATGIEFKI